MTVVKICGIRTLVHARAALDAGADLLGFVFFRPSFRYVDPEVAGQIVAACRAEYGGTDRWQAVAVLVDEPPEHARSIFGSAGLDVAQLCGAEDRSYGAALERPVLRVVHVGRDSASLIVGDAATYGAQRLLLDTAVPGQYGGTGRTYAWESVRCVAAESFLAGGLAPANVARAIAVARPWGVDVSSGVERGGVKDSELIREFIREVRRADRDAI